MSGADDFSRGAAFRASSFTRSADETVALGRRFAKTLKGGERLLLQGGLGAGKTWFCRGLAEGLGVSGPVQSPTFTLEMRHDPGRPGGLAFFHYDAYRLSGEEEWYELGFDEGPDARTVAAIEWPERLGSARRGDDILIVLERGEGDDERRLSLYLPLSVEDERARDMEQAFTGEEQA